MFKGGKNKKSVRIYISVVTIKSKLRGGPQMPGSNKCQAQGNDGIGWYPGIFYQMI